MRCFDELGATDFVVFFEELRGKESARAVVKMTMQVLLRPTMTIAIFQEFQDIVILKLAMLFING